MSSAAIDLRGKVAVVTGGSRGIGRGIAAGLRAAGADVSVWSRDLDVARATADELGGHAARCDVRSRDDVDAALAATVERFGKVDVLVHAAGRPAALQPFLELSAEAWDDVIDTNLTGTFRVCQAVGRQMAAAGEGGKIILISSIRVIAGAPSSGEYAASKGGVESLMRSLALALGPYAIQINAVRPGWIRTDMTEGLWSDPERSDLPATATPAGRWGVPDDFAGLVSYLASDASGFHTGDVLTVDGGLTAAAGGGISPAPVTTQSTHRRPAA